MKYEVADIGSVLLGFFSFDSNLKLNEITGKVLNMCCGLGGYE